MKLSRKNTPPPPCPQIRYGKIESTLVRKPRYGVYLRWPENGTDWIHPDDVETALHAIPGRRIFCKTDAGDGWVLVAYGKIQFRVRPSMWLEVPEPDYRVGDQVEVKSKLGRTKPQIATVREVFWDQPNRLTEFHLERLGKPLRRVFRSDELQPTVRLGEVLEARHLDKRGLLS